MDYSSSLDYLYALQFFGIKLGLENTYRLLDSLDNPQTDLRIVHLAGTNGKGSTAAALERILAGLGYRTGLYTSPHLHSFTERIRIDNRPISEADVVRHTAEIRARSPQIKPTFFEFTTVMALREFAEQQVDWAILETGMGGRLDATNVVQPKLCIITPVALDHAAYLGESLARIAAEKGGIIKPAVPLICAVQHPEVLRVLQELARQQQAPLLQASQDFSWTPAPAPFAYRGLAVDIAPLEPGLRGPYQRENISLAMAAAERLLAPQILPGDLVKTAVSALRWPGRLEWCGDILLDGAHNAHGAEGLADFLRQENLDNLLWVLAVKGDKDLAGILRPLFPHVERFFAAPLAAESSAPFAAIQQLAQVHKVPGESFASLGEAFTRALAVKRPGQKILVAGSLFLVAELRQQCLALAGVGA
jgi:dihydrofolate synthase/folylpolyglutamate synthase